MSPNPGVFTFNCGTLLFSIRGVFAQSRRFGNSANTTEEGKHTAQDGCVRTSFCSNLANLNRGQCTSHCVSIITKRWSNTNALYKCSVKHRAFYMHRVRRGIFCNSKA